jgi:outer membrane protein
MGFRVGMVTRKAITGLAVVAFVAGLMGSVSAETIESALARAYSSNPDLNAQRAQLRAIDENVPRALSGYRPRVGATGDLGVSNLDVTGRGGSGFSSMQNDSFWPRGAALTIDQTLYNGNRTTNSVRRADVGVLAGRASLRTSEQTLLNDAATAYMDVLRDTAFLNLRSANIDVLNEQLRQTQDRFNVGEVTRTDVAQVEARLAAGRSEWSLAEGNLKASIARYRQVIGVEPKQLAPAKPLERLLPKNLDEAVRSALSNHPAIIAAAHNVDAAQLDVKIVEGELYPSVGLQGSAQRRWDYQGSNVELMQAQVVGRLNVPIYEGGEVYARVRQSKETLGQRQLELDLARDRVRAAVVATWSQLEAAKARIQAAEAQIQAATIALNGVREEAKVGQRTTLDVLITDQDLLSARVNLVAAQRDRVVISYQVLAAMGQLSATRLGLKVDQYNATTHYNQVRDKWIGLRTPDGR